MTDDHSDRRKEPRHVVGDIDAQIDGQECAVLDISASAVRVLKPGGYNEGDSIHRLVLKIAQAEYEVFVNVSSTEIRRSTADLVLRYTPPFEGWALLLRSLDTFEQTKLAELNF